MHIGMGIRYILVWESDAYWYVNQMHTGMGIFERSRPKQFFMISQRLTLSDGLSGTVSLLTAKVGFQPSKKFEDGPIGD